MTHPADPSQNTPAYLDILDEACLLYGIEPDFWDIWGKHHVPDPEVKIAILRAKGVDCSSEESLAASVKRRTQQNAERVLPPTLVIAAEQKRLPLPDGVAAQCELRLEDGRLLQFSGAVLPLGIPLGYHELSINVSGCETRTRLIVSPGRAWLPASLENGGKTAGVAVSLYGVRSKTNWGCGDCTDLEALLDWVHEDLHCSFLSLNPLHAIDNRQPYNISPYLPNSALFRNPLYIDVTRVPEFQTSKAAASLFQSAAVRDLLQKLRESPHVEYENAWKLKRLFLAVLYREFRRAKDPVRQQQFANYRRMQGENLRRFSAYCSIWDWLHQRNPDLWIWPEWPVEYQDPQSHAVAEFCLKHESQILFHSYMQWVLDTQLEAAQNKARSMGLAIGLYHDLALATDKCGADLWSYREYYIPGCRVGSPPDGFAPEGQDWAFPPPDSEKLRANGYRLFIDSIRANSRHGGALRIDHVMRLFRLYWIPDGMTAKHGAYVRDFYEDLLGILALESHRNRFLIVGEDLGTVADNVRLALDQFGVLSYKVFYFEKDGRRFRRSEEYPRQALVSSTTHDLPTLAGFWTNRDIEARKDAGLLPDGESYKRQLQERIQDKQTMLDVLHEMKLLPDWFPRKAEIVPELTGELHNAIIGFLVRTPCMLLVLNQEDLTKETEQQNLPASTWQYPNWQRKMKYTVEELRTHRVALDFATMFRNWIARYRA